MRREQDSNVQVSDFLPVAITIRAIGNHTIYAEQTLMERDIINITSKKSETAEAVGFEFDTQTDHYIYMYDTEVLEKVSS